MAYEVYLTDNAFRQLQDAIGYISTVLLEPEVAKQWSLRLKAEIMSLDTMPFRFPLIEHEPWRSEGIRKMNVQNFLVYYWVNEKANTVWVTAIVYGKRDQLSALRSMPGNDS